MAKQAPKPGVIDQTRSFVQDVRVEMDKVTWPSREDLKASTTVVLFFLGLLAVVVGGMDIVFQNVMLWLLKLT